MFDLVLEFGSLGSVVRGGLCWIPVEEIKF